MLSALHQSEVLDTIAELLANVAENPEDLDDLGQFIDQLTSKYNYYKDTSRDDRRTIAYRNSVRLDQTRDAALRLVNQGERARADVFFSNKSMFDIFPIMHVF